MTEAGLPRGNPRGTQMVVCRTAPLAFPPLPCCSCQAVGALVLLARRRRSRWLEPPAAQAHGCCDAGFMPLLFCGFLSQPPKWLQLPPSKRARDALRAAQLPLGGVLLDALGLSEFGRVLVAWASLRCRRGTGLLEAPPPAALASRRPSHLRVIGGGVSAHALWTPRRPRRAGDRAQRAMAGHGVL